MMTFIHHYLNQNLALNSEECKSKQSELQMKKIWLNRSAFCMNNDNDDNCF